MPQERGHRPVDSLVSSERRHRRGGRGRRGRRLMAKLNLIALILNVVFFGVNVWLLIRHRRKARAPVTTSTREDRIERVVAEYMHLATSHVDTGVHALIVAGVKGLHTSEEMADAISRIPDRTDPHPFAGDAGRLSPASREAVAPSSTAL